MSLFSRSKTEVTIDLDRSQIIAGETLSATARWAGLDGRTQGGRIELLYRNTYQEDVADAEGDRSTRTRTEDVVIANQVLFEKGAADAGDAHVELLVPAEAPGSAAGSIEWLVRAVVDRKMARDTRADALLTVLSPPDPLVMWAQTPSSVESDLPLALEAPDRVVRAGEPITGTFTVSSTGGVEVRAARVQLARHRLDKDRNSDVDDSTRVIVAEPLELAAGDSRAFPFELTVPADAAPSFRAAHNTQHWFLEGVLDKPRRKDDVVRLEVVVHTA